MTAIPSRAYADGFDLFEGVSILGAHEYVSSSDANVWSTGTRYWKYHSVYTFENVVEEGEYGVSSQEGLIDSNLQDILELTPAVAVTGYEFDVQYTTSASFLNAGEKLFVYFPTNPSIVAKYAGYAYTYKSVTLNNIRVYVHTPNTEYLLTKDSEGTYTIPSVDGTITGFKIRFGLSGNTDTQYLYLYINRPHVIIVDRSTSAITQNQTNQLKDTTGSGGIASGVTEDAYELVDSLGFVSQTASFVTGAYDAVANSTADATLPFPGLTIMGHTIISPANVAFVVLPDSIMTPIRTAVTMVIAIAWVNGLIGIYHKIFLGEHEVTVVDEE